VWRGGYQGRFNKNGGAGERERSQKGGGVLPKGIGGGFLKEKTARMVGEQKTNKTEVGCPISALAILEKSGGGQGMNQGHIRMGWLPWSRESGTHGPC